jgi:glycosyltransferase involved in cell wall biosynthesis
MATSAIVLHEGGRRLKVAMIFYSFPRDMGYSNTMLARYLARLGADVHYIATDLPVYHKDRHARSAYSQFSADRTMTPGESEVYDGYTVHCIGHRHVLGVPMFTGLFAKLREIQPDVVQLFINAGWAPLQTAAAKLGLGFKLYSAAHTTISVFPLARRKLRPWDREWIANLAMRAIPGRVVSMFTERCYAATDDCAEVATRFYGMPERKVAVVPLGVDIENFYPLRTAEDRERRGQLRRDLGFTDGDVVCIYTGQFTDAKNPIVLARAIAMLRRSDLQVRGLFIGNGPQNDEIAAFDGCVVLPFRPHRELPAYYRAADIGVWPTQESMSMLDAAACGLPIIVNGTLLAKERIDGNGITYRLNDAVDLAEKISLLSDMNYRRQLGSIGSRRMTQLFSWDNIARRRLADYEAALAAPQ